MRIKKERKPEKLPAKLTSKRPYIYEVILYKNIQGGKRHYCNHD